VGCFPFEEDLLEMNSCNVLVRACSSVDRRPPLTTSFITSMFWGLVVTALCCAQAGAQDVRIEHVTIISPERSRPMPNATVYIHDDRIVSISSTNSVPAHRSKASGDVIDGQGLYLVPGLIDSHVHIGDIPGMTSEQEQKHPDIASATRGQIPRSFLYFGFTTLVELISTPDVIARWNAQELHPDIYFCGGAPIVDGYPMNWQPKPRHYEWFPYMIVERGEEKNAPAGIDPAAHTPEQVVTRMKAEGAMCVKSFHERGFGEEQDIPAPRLDTIRDLVQAAHAAKMPVFLHANGTNAQEFALEAGVDVIAHGLWHWHGEPQTATELTTVETKVLDGVVKTQTGWQPTMQVLYGERDLFDPAYLSDPALLRVFPASYIEWCRSPEGQWFHRELIDALLTKPVAESNDAAAQWNAAKPFFAAPLTRNKNATSYLVKRGARILFGTDTPSAPTYANPPGLNGWIEMHRLVDAGLTPSQVFLAATIVNAKALGLDQEIGTVQSGKRANLLLLRKDPTQSVEAYDEIVKVILHGRVIDRAELAANRPAASAGRLAQ
jgi:imidazolonepropionase-like amidohydrolase